MTNTRRDHRWTPALGRWNSPGFYEWAMGLFSLADLPAQVGSALQCEKRSAVLDLGCGPGLLARWLLQTQLDLRVIGLDPDRRMLTRAAANNPSGGAGWTEGLAQKLPFADGAFDRIAVIFVLHHLTHAQKVSALAEGYRALAPRGRLHIVDWTKPSGLAAAGFLLVRALDGFERTADHAEGRLYELVQGAGFEDLETLFERDLLLGRIVHLRARKPEKLQVEILPTELESAEAGL